VHAQCEQKVLRPPVPKVRRSSAFLPHSHSKSSTTTASAGFPSVVSRTVALNSNSRSIRARTRTRPPDSRLMLFSSIIVPRYEISTVFLPMNERTSASALGGAACRIELIWDSRNEEPERLSGPPNARFHRRTRRADRGVERLGVMGYQARPSRNLMGDENALRHQRPPIRAPGPPCNARRCRPGVRPSCPLTVFWKEPSNGRDRRRLLRDGSACPETLRRRRLPKCAPPQEVS